MKTTLHDLSHRKEKLYRRATSSCSETVSGKNLIDCAHNHNFDESLFIEFRFGRRCFGGHSQCGYWARLPSVGRLEAARGVRFPYPPRDRPTRSCEWYFRTIDTNAMPP